MSGGPQSATSADSIGARPGRLKRVLMVAQQFYPCAAIGCHRTGKFCKYLPEFGWKASVLTVAKDYSNERYDPSLLKQLPADTEILRTFYPDEAVLRHLVRSVLRRRPPTVASPAVSAPSANGSRPQIPLIRWLAVPDWAVYWWPWAVSAGLRMARRADAIYATAPPHGSLVIAATLARLARRRLVLDLRDPWMLDRTLAYPTSAHRAANERLERWCFGIADRIVVNTVPARDAYRRLHPDLADRFVTVPNGYDRADFDGLTPTAIARRDPRAVTMAYVGNLHGERDPRPLLRAARQLQGESAGALRAEVHFWSATGELVASAIRDAGAEAIATLHDPVAHRDALGAMLGVDVLLVFGASDTDDLHVPGKLFEYIYCRKPILALVRRGAISDLIDEYRLGLWCAPDDTTTLAQHLRRLAEWRVSGTPWPFRPDVFTAFDRREQARQLAELLNG